MIICSCNRLTDKAVRGCCRDACGVAGVYRSLGCAPKCGRCAATISAIIEQARAAAPECECIPGRCSCLVQEEQAAA